MSSYPETLSWLYATQERGIKLGLDRMRDFLAALGWEQGAQRFLHAAGPNVFAFDYRGSIGPQAVSQVFIGVS